MKPSTAYILLQRLSPETLDAIDRMLERGWSPWNAAHLLTTKYPSHIARLIRPAAIHAAQIATMKRAA